MSESENETIAQKENYTQFIENLVAYAEAKDQLEEKLEDAGTEQKKELLDDIFAKIFLEDVDTNIEEIRKTGSEKQEVVN